MRTKTYTLPGGYYDTKNKLHAVAEIGEMTGNVQAEMARPENVGNAVRQGQIALTHCVKKIGEAPVGDALFGFMLTGDLDYVLFQSLRPWKGSVVTGTIECRACKTPFTLPLPLKDFKKYMLKQTYEEAGKVASADDECPVEVIKGVERVADPETLTTSWVFKVNSDEHEIKATFRLPYGADSDRCAGLAQKNAAEAQHLMLAITCLELNGTKGPFVKDTFGAMPQSTLDWLFEQLRDHTPGLAPHDTIVRCSSCNSANMPVLSDFLPRGARTRRLSTAK